MSRAEQQIYLFRPSGELGAGGADGELRMPEPPHDVVSQERLAAWIATIPRRQTFNELATADDGETPYREILIIRPFCRAVQNNKDYAYRSCIAALAWEIYMALLSAPGHICWRVRPEFKQDAYPVMVRGGKPHEKVPGAPDRDYVTDRYGWSDNQYEIIGGYMRFAVLADE